MEFVSVKESQYPELTQIWEASVRATHNFLKEEDVCYYKERIQSGDYFRMVDLVGLSDESGELFAFMGIADHKLEMLFIHPSERGKGYGKLLLCKAVNELGVTELDVNEQNFQAVAFYKHMGFEVVGRSDKDGEGKEYPLLHMAIGRK